MEKYIPKYTNEQLNKSLDLILKASDLMPDFLFESFKKEFTAKFEPLFVLIAEGYDDLFSIINLFFLKRRTQAGIILRTCIERISKTIVILNNPEYLLAYLDFASEHEKFVLMSDEDKEKFISLKKKLYHDFKINQFFDYGWAGNISGDMTIPKKNDIIKLAGCEQFIIDIDEILNKFVHCSMSMYDFSTRDLILRQGRRMCEMTVSLFQRLDLYTNKLLRKYSDDSPTNEAFNYSINILEIKERKQK